mgnify:CR=1 FL=1
MNTPARDTASKPPAGTFDRANARFAGAMFLLAMVASLSGGLLLQSILNQPDLLTAIDAQKPLLLAGVVLELLNAFAVIGIAAAFWVPLKRRAPGMTAGYLALRTLEAAVCFAAALIPLLLLGLTGPNGAGRFSADGDIILYATMLNTLRDGITAYAVPIFFAAGGLLLYIMLLRSGLVHKYIAVWGIIAVFCVAANMFVPDVMIKGLLALPIILNEVYLGGYLLIKGFRKESQ